jgi:hypothetical protein
MSQENLLMTEEPEDNYGSENEEEAFKEEFNHPADGALIQNPEESRRGGL